MRAKGQFWTPDCIAEAMAAYALAGGAQELFDPAVGAGAFFRAAKRLAGAFGRNIRLTGTEIDPTVLVEARLGGLSPADLEGVEIADFVLQPPARRFPAIVANPPYIRHHRLPANLKRQLRFLGVAITGQTLDGRAGLHVYFLLRTLDLLSPNGRLAIIVPADTVEGVFAPSLWRWIASHYCLEAVITFAPEATPFPSVDTNPVILLIKRAKPASHLWRAECLQAGTEDLRDWILSGFRCQPRGSTVVSRIDLSQALARGLSRPPAEPGEIGPCLGQFAKVLRGVATGANDFFFFTAEKARMLGIPAEFLVPAIGKTRDVAGDEITIETVRTLETDGKPTLLFSPGGHPKHMFPPAVRRYLEKGEEMGLPRKPLLASRRPWYKMESRAVPPIVFAYLGRRNARFIRNRAGVIPLTGFLCVYPRGGEPQQVETLWTVLRHPQTLANLRLVGKSYGGGAIKVEPRALERLPLPADIVAGLRPEQRDAGNCRQLRFNIP